MTTTIQLMARQVSGIRNPESGIRNPELHDARVGFRICITMLSNVDARQSRAETTQQLEIASPTC